MKIGIDLGTTYSVVSYVDEKGNSQIVTNSEGERKTPSVIMFEDNNVIVGEVAKAEKAFDPTCVVDLIKRSMGLDITFPYKGNNYSPEQLSAFILKKLVQDTENATGEKVEGAVITVPAYFNDAERQSTIDAGKIAGINVLGIINEPTAAAVAYGIESASQNSKVLVYDLGGGTFDVTVLEINDGKLEILGTDGDHKLGGADFDNKIIDYLADQIDEKFDYDIDDDEELYEEISLEAERIKKGLSSKNTERISFKVNGNTYKDTYTLEQFELAIEPLVNRSLTLIQSCLSEIGLKASDLDKILLVGGSSRIPLIEKMIIDKFGITPSRELHPDEIVAQGAGIIAHKKTLDNIEIKNLDPNHEKIKNLKIIDVNSHGIGIRSQNDEGQQENTIMIPKNTPIPTTATRSFFTIGDNQEYVILTLCEGDDIDLDYVEEIANARVDLPSNRMKGSELIFEIGFDLNGKITCTAYDGQSSTKLKTIEVERKHNLSEKEIDMLSEDIENIEIK